MLVWSMKAKDKYLKCYFFNHLFDDTGSTDIYSALKSESESEAGQLQDHVSGSVLVYFRVIIKVSMGLMEVNCEESQLLNNH